MVFYSFIKVVYHVDTGSVAGIGMILVLDGRYFW